MNSFFEEYGITIIEFLFLFLVYKILYSLLEIIWGLPV